MFLREIKGKAFSASTRIHTFDDIDQCLPGKRPGQVGAIIGNHQDPGAISAGLLKPSQTIRNDRIFIVGRDNDDPVRPPLNDRIWMRKRSQPDKQLNGEAQSQNCERHQNERENYSHGPDLPIVVVMRERPSRAPLSQSENEATCRNVKESLASLRVEERESRMKFESPAALLRVAPPNPRRLGLIADILFAIGCALLVLPTMIQVARDTWSTEQGGHGPLVLATGIWALWRELKNHKVERRPAKMWVAMALLTLSLGVFVVARITGILEIEAFAMYGALVAAAYAIFGGALIKAIWFPLVYLAFALPPPDTVVAAVTQPIKIAISDWAVSLLYLAGYPIANSGVIIQIGQYELLVAAACAGLNSIVTLTALCLFYVYLRHRSNLMAFFVIALAAIPVAIISNFIRVLTLVLVTYYFGEAAAQGFIHDFAGLLMFAVALLAILAVDRLASPLFAERKAKVSA